MNKEEKTALTDIHYVRLVPVVKCYNKVVTGVANEI